MEERSGSRASIVHRRLQRVKYQFALHRRVHHLPNTMLADGDPTRTQLGVDARLTVGSAALGMHVENGRAKFGIRAIARARPTGSPLVKSAVRDGKDDAPHVAFFAPR